MSTQTTSANAKQGQAYQRESVELHYSINGRAWRRFIQRHDTEAEAIVAMEKSRRETRVDSFNVGGISVRLPSRPIDKYRYRIVRVVSTCEVLHLDKE